MTQELQDLRISILEGRYDDALAIVDELDWMSRKGLIRNIRSYLIRLMIHLIKNQIEGRLTKSWIASIKGSLLEIQDLNLQENKTAHYLKQDEWDELLDIAFEAAIDPASTETLEGRYSSRQLRAIIDREGLFKTTQTLLELTYLHSQKELPLAIDQQLIQLPGGIDWSSDR